MENLAPETLVVTLDDARAAIVCRRDQLRLRRFSVTSATVPFGQPVRLRLEMPFCRRRFDLMGTVVSERGEGVELDLDPIPGELELLIDYLERAEIEGPRPAFRALEDDEESSTSIEIQFDESMDDSEVTVAEDSGIWTDRPGGHETEVDGGLDPEGMGVITRLLGDDGATGVLRIDHSGGRILGYLQAGTPLLFLAEPPPEEGNLDLALIASPDIDLDAFGEAIEQQERTGDPLGAILLSMDAIAPDALLALARTEAGLLLDALEPDPDGRFVYRSAEIPGNGDGDEPDVAAMLLAASVLLAEDG